MKTLLHAINGYGLGHVVRLSVVSQALSAACSDIVQQMISPCSSASEYFPGPCFRVPCDLADLGGHEEQVLAHVNKFKPDVMIFDTRWPKALPKYLSKKGIKRMLVLRAFPTEMMRAAVVGAKNDFDNVLLPHSWDELKYYYGTDNKLLETLAAPPFTIVGPLARLSDSSSTDSSIIFTIGAGKPYATDIKGYVQTFVKAAEILSINGFRNLLFLAGPLMTGHFELGPLIPIRNSPTAHQLLGFRSSIISRGGYNTCWEAIGAGSHLIVSATYNPVEDVEARCRYLDDCGFARKASFEPKAIALTVMRGHPENIESGRRMVNSGFVEMVKAILN